MIDNAQGDEADLSSTTWSPHLHRSSAEDLRGTPAFVAADFRCTLSLSRSTAFLVVLANRGNFIGHEKNEITQGRVQDLARVYKFFAQRGVNKRIRACKRCKVDISPPPDRLTLAGAAAPTAFLVVLANRGDFVGHEKNAITQGRAQDLAVYKFFAQRGVNKRFKPCKNCETHDHTADDCTADDINMSDKICERTSCGEEGHTAAFYPKRFYGNCAERNHHTSDERPLDDFLCSAYGLKGHNYFNCTTSAGSQWCTKCETSGHTQFRCP
ncbi:hypothetical protein ACHAPM_003843 [Fusarium culmorum]